VTKPAPHQPPPCHLFGGAGFPGDMKITTTIWEKAISLARNEDVIGAFKFLDNIQDPTAFVMMVDINRGERAHQWAWDVLEDWRNHDEPTWVLPHVKDDQVGADFPGLDYSDYGGI
jgi:hypothetical protein